MTANPSAYTAKASTSGHNVEVGTTTGVRLASVLTATQVWRIAGALFVFETFRGNLPATFGFPAGVGDILVGITAPIVALALRRGGP